MPADLARQPNPTDGAFGKKGTLTTGFGDGTFNTPVLVEAADGFHNRLPVGATSAGVQETTESELVVSVFVDVGDAQLGLPQKGVVGALEDLALLGDRADDGFEGGTLVDVAERAGVDLAHPAVARDCDRFVDASRDPVRPHEVPTRAARDHRDLDARAPGDAVRHLVDGPVAADDDELRRAAVRRLACQARQVARLLREQRVPSRNDRELPARGCDS